MSNGARISVLFILKGEELVTAEDEFFKNAGDTKSQSPEPCEQEYFSPLEELSPEWNILPKG
jgi:hypothetical protein